MTQAENAIADIIFNRIGGVTLDAEKGEAVYQFAREIAQEITNKLPIGKRADDRTNNDPQFDRYRTFPECDVIGYRQSQENWLACLQQGKNPVEEILWQK